MSLVDKISDMDVGDLVIFVPKRKSLRNRVGYVVSLEDNKITLCNGETVNQDGKPLNMRWIIRPDEVHIYDVHLDEYKSYEIIKKIN
jgi:hypothetical protein